MNQSDRWMNEWMAQWLLNKSRPIWKLTKVDKTRSVNICVYDWWKQSNQNQNPLPIRMYISINRLWKYFLIKSNKMRHSSRIKYVLPLEKKINDNNNNVSWPFCLNPKQVGCCLCTTRKRKEIKCVAISFPFRSSSDVGRFASSFLFSSNARIRIYFFYVSHLVLLSYTSVWSPRM